MDRAGLERLLAAGLSLEEIGRRVGRDPSTVGHWLRKHGLEAVHRGRHAPRGGIDRATLEALVERGLSTRAIAAEFDRSQGTVRHWLRQYGLRTSAAAPRCARPHTVERICPRHGLAPHTRFGNQPQYRCRRCNSERVAARRRRVKEILVREAGGCCRLCGYDRSLAALHFHHLDPGQKAFGIAHRGVSRSLARARAEVEKCVLLCSNCHAEVEAGLVDYSSERALSAQVHQIAGAE